MSVENSSAFYPKMYSLFQLLVEVCVLINNINRQYHSVMYKFTISCFIYTEKYLQGDSYNESTTIKVFARDHVKCPRNCNSDSP